MMHLLSPLLSAPALTMSYGSSSDNIGRLALFFSLHLLQIPESSVYIYESEKL